jgi:hypothetical protein
MPRRSRVPVCSSASAPTAPCTSSAATCGRRTRSRWQRAKARTRMRASTARERRQDPTARRRPPVPYPRRPLAILRRRATSTLELPEFRESTLHIVTGLLLPIWRQLPNQRRHQLQLAQHADLGGRERPIPRDEGGDRGRGHVIGRILDPLAVEDGGSIDLLDDVADMDGRRRRAPVPQTSGCRFMSVSIRCSASSRLTAE